MKASELILRLRGGFTYVVECEAMRETATMLERFIALADELEQGPVFRLGRVMAIRIREILEET